MAVQPLEIPLFPLNVVLFPKMMLPLHIFEDRYKAMIRFCLDGKAPFGVCLIESGAEVGPPAIPHKMGTTAEIITHQALDEGRMNLAVAGRDRFRIVELIREQPYLVALVEPMPDVQKIAGRRTALIEELRSLFKRYLSLLLLLTGGWTHELESPKDPLDLAYYIAARLTTLALPERQSLLEQESLEDLLRSEVVLLHREISRLQSISTQARRGN